MISDYKKTVALGALLLFSGTSMQALKPGYLLAGATMAFVNGVCFESFTNTKMSRPLPLSSLVPVLFPSGAMSLFLCNEGLQSFDDEPEKRHTPKRRLLNSVLIAGVIVGAFIGGKIASDLFIVRRLFRLGNRGPFEFNIKSPFI